MTDPLAFAARHARTILILGLAAGVAFPSAAHLLKPWIAEFVIAMLFIAALRVGPRAALGAARDLPAAFGITFGLQVLAPILAILAFGLVGWTGPLATGLILMFAAPPMSGSPNLTILTGNDPAPALRQVVIGTAILSLTIIPVLWLAPDLGGVPDVIAASARLFLVIACATGAGFLVRGLWLRTPSPETNRRIDGFSAILLAFMVVALMSEVGPALRTDPASLAAALVAVFAGSFGIQLLVVLMLRGRAPERLIAPVGIIAGNRNIALFLTALPAGVTDPLLLFIGCYQFPMYLSPVLLSRLYPSTPQAGGM